MPVFGLPGGERKWCAAHKPPDAVQLAKRKRKWGSGMGAARSAGALSRRGEKRRRTDLCDHCGATESPQWRPGPEEKPQLCNACGTRYRRGGLLQNGRGSSAKVQGRRSVAAAA